MWLARLYITPPPPPPHTHTKDILPGSTGCYGHDVCTAVCLPLEPDATARLPSSGGRCLSGRSSGGWHAGSGSSASEQSATTGERNYLKKLKSYPLGSTCHVYYAFSPPSLSTPYIQLQAVAKGMVCLERLCRNGTREKQEERASTEIWYAQMNDTQKNEH